MISSANDETERSKCVQKNAHTHTHTYKIHPAINCSHKNQMTSMQSVSDECAIIPKIHEIAKKNQ